MRFDEALDQAICESGDFFAAENERWRHLFLGILGHDLRTPLNAIALTSQLLSEMNSTPAAKEVGKRLQRSSERMRVLLENLLDYNRSSLALGIPHHPSLVELELLCEEEIELQRAAWPGQVIELESHGPTQGTWDASRLKQAVGNLISNAVKYGDKGQSIAVRLVGYTEMVTLSVENKGPTIPAACIDSLFDPLRRATQGEGYMERTSLGLGLFVVREIVQAHGGLVSVSSGDGRTVFTVTLPKGPPTEA